MTTSQFQPLLVEPLDAVVPRFIELQSELLNLVQASIDLDLNRIKITSPISNQVRYNLYSCFLVIAAHQRRHLWQAERTRRSLLAKGQ
jgi:hypothetical protein